MTLYTPRSEDIMLNFEKAYILDSDFRKVGIYLTNSPSLDDVIEAMDKIEARGGRNPIAIFHHTVVNTAIDIIPYTRKHVEMVRDSNARRHQAVDTPREPKEAH